MLPPEGRKLPSVGMEKKSPTLVESFPYSYEAVAQGRLPTPDDLLYFPSRPALVVQVTPHRGEPWSAAFGEDYFGFPSGLYTTPAPDTVCVVAGGAGYFVETRDPQHGWVSLACTPVRFVLPFASYGLLVFGSFIDFVAYHLNPDDDQELTVAWRSARLGWDDLAVTRVTDDRIEGEAWHAPEDRMIGFSLDVRSGEHEGGAYPRER